MINNNLYQLKRCCCEPLSNIENYSEAMSDSDNVWDLHHRLETHNSDGERRLVDLTMGELIALDVYYHRPASELIFMKRAEHQCLHHKGKHFGFHSDEWKIKMSEANKGERNPMYGKHWKLVDGKRVYY